MLLRDDDAIATDRGKDERGETEVSGVITMPDPAREGVLAVLSMKALLRAVNKLRGATPSDDFERALVKIVNLNGALARTVLDGKRR